MNYLNITKYIYLVVGFIMTYSAIVKWRNDENVILEVMIAFVAFFTFFFRNRFAKKFEHQKNQNQKDSNKTNP